MWTVFNLLYHAGVKGQRQGGRQHPRAAASIAQHGIAARSRQGHPQHESITLPRHPVHCCVASRRERNPHVKGIRSPPRKHRVFNTPRPTDRNPAPAPAAARRCTHTAVRPQCVHACMQVRDPTGPLPLLGYPDERGNPIPDIFGTGNMTDGTLLPRKSGSTELYPLRGQCQFRMNGTTLFMPKG